MWVYSIDIWGSFFYFLDFDHLINKFAQFEQRKKAIVLSKNHKHLVLRLNILANFMYCIDLYKFLTEILI